MMYAVWLLVYLGIGFGLCIYMESTTEGSMSGGALLLTMFIWPIIAIGLVFGWTALKLAEISKL